MSTSRKRRRSRSTGASPDPGEARGRGVRRTVVLVLVLSSAAVGIHFAIRFVAGSGGSVRQGGDGDAPLRAADFVPTPVIPLSEIPWPTLPADAESELDGAISEIRRALALYAQAERLAAGTPPDAAAFRRNSAAADSAMTRGLARLESLGALVPELGPYQMHLVRTALAARDYDAARAQLEAWLSRFPDSYDHRLELGKVVFQLSRWAESVENLRRAAALRPASLEARYWLAEACDRMGAREEGIAAIRQGLALLSFPSEELWSHPMGKTFLGNAIKVLHRFREYGLLAEVAASYRGKEPGSVEAAMAEGVALVHLGRYVAAVPLLRRALSDPHNREEVLFTLGLAQSKQKKWKDAAASFSSLLVEQPFFVRAYYQLGLCLARLDREQQADVLFARSRDLAGSERELRRALELEGTGHRGRAAVARSRAYGLRGQYDQAEAVLRQRDLRENPFAVIALAELYIEMLRISEAERVLAHAATFISPSHADLQGNRARIQFARGQEADALARLAQLVARPESPRAWRLVLAELLLEGDRLDEALRVLSAAAEGPDGKARFRLGCTLLLAGRSAQALETLRTVSRGDKRWAVWRGDLWLAWALAAGDDGDAALAEAVDLLDAAPESDRGRREYLEARLAVIERTSRNPTRAASLTTALQKYEQTRGRVKALRNRIARSAWPASGPMYLELARVLKDRGERSEAIRFARYAALASPGSPEPLRALAAWLTSPGDVFFRLRALRDLSARSPGDDAVRSEVRRLEAEWLTAGDDK